MHDTANRARIQRALNSRLAGLEGDPNLARHIIAENERSPRMKKKLSLGLVLAVILILLSLTALAVSNWPLLKQYFTTVRSMSATGELARWSSADKLKFLTAMRDAHLVKEDGRLTAAFDETLPIEQRAMAAESIIAERYGPDYFDNFTVEEAELPTAERTKEEQDAYQQWDEAYIASWNAPGATPVPFDKTTTYRDAVGYLTEVGNFPLELIRAADIHSTFSEETGYWTVTVSIDKALYESHKTANEKSLFDSPDYAFEENGKLFIRFTVDKSGTQHQIEMKPKEPTALSLGDALPIAEQALVERAGVTKDRLHTLVHEFSLGESGQYDTQAGRFRPCFTFIYRDQQGDALYFASIDANTGKVLSAFDSVQSEKLRVRYMEQIKEIKALLDQAGVGSSLINRQGVYHWRWTVEERAAWSAVARPIVQKYRQEHPEFETFLREMTEGKQSIHDWDPLINLTEHLYGIPDEQAIPMEKAYAIAFEKAIAMGANAQYIEDKDHHNIFYDITDAARPLWKVDVNMLFGDSDTTHPLKPTDWWGYMISIDAHTGSIVDAFPYNVSTPMRKRM